VDVKTTITAVAIRRGISLLVALNPSRPLEYNIDAPTIIETMIVRRKITVNISTPRSASMRANGETKPQEMPVERARRTPIPCFCAKLVM
jgi:hypothetical protein